MFSNFYVPPTIVISQEIAKRRTLLFVSTHNRSGPEDLSAKTNAPFNYPFLSRIAEVFCWLVVKVSLIYYNFLQSSREFIDEREVYENWQSEKRAK